MLSACDCNPFGSLPLSACDVDTGQCLCQTFATGPHCEECTVCICLGFPLYVSLVCSLVCMGFLLPLPRRDLVLLIAFFVLMYFRLPWEELFKLQKPANSRVFYNSSRESQLLNTHRYTNFYHPGTDARRVMRCSSESAKQDRL